MQSNGRAHIASRETNELRKSMRYAKTRVGGLLKRLKRLFFLGKLKKFSFESSGMV
jgi:hypothetical protein